MCEQNLEFFNVEPGGTYSKHWALNVVCESNGILRRKFKVLQFMQCNPLENSESLAFDAM